MASGKTFKFVANRTQSGQYWCSVENGLNVTINASAQLDVQCKLKKWLRRFILHLFELNLITSYS